MHAFVAASNACVYKTWNMQCNAIVVGIVAAAGSERLSVALRVLQPPQYACVVSVSASCLVLASLAS